MNKQQLGKTIQVGEYLITPVEQMVVSSTCKGKTLMFQIVYEPKGIIIEINGLKWALDIQGNRMNNEDWA